ncbi:hypothetical protein AVEN_211874-1, partial [Araneus ventricosus]
MSMCNSCCLPPISKGPALFFSWGRCSREGNLTLSSFTLDSTDSAILVVRCGPAVKRSWAQSSL